MRKAFALVSAVGLADGVTHIEVLHDATCPVLTASGECDCEPDVRLMEPR